MQSSGQWSSGLCDCCSNPVCCTACCCPCCIYGQIAAALSPEETPCGGNYCGACCCFYTLYAAAQGIDALFALSLGLHVGTIVCPLSIIIHCPTRGAIRRRYNIQGDAGEDCLVVWCCMCCALAQVGIAFTCHIAYLYL